MKLRSAFAVIPKRLLFSWCRQSRTLDSVLCADVCVGNIPERKKNTTFSILALLAGSLAIHAAIAATPADYATLLPIETDGSSAAWQVELNAEVYAWVQDAALRDIAIFNAAGHAVPLSAWQTEVVDTTTEQRAVVALLALPRTTTAQQNNDLRLLIERDAEGRLRRFETSEPGPSIEQDSPHQWLFDVHDFDLAIDEITLSWSAPDVGVIARFSVEGSSDLQSWQSVRRDAAVILLEQDGARIERREIGLDRAHFAYFRLTRLDDGAELLDLRAEVSSQNRQAGAVAPLQWIEAARVNSIADMQSSDKHFLYALPAALPVTQLRIDLANDNALAQINVFTPVAAKAGTTRWEQRAQLVAYRLLEGETLIENGEFAISTGPRLRELRVDSSTPLAQTPRLRAGYRPDRLVFLAEGDGPYLLAVGSARARHPDYPINAAVTSLRAQFGQDWQPPLAKLGAARASAGASALMAPAKPLAWRNWLLWIVLIGATAVVAGIALSLLRGGAKSSAEEGQQPPEK